MKIETRTRKVRTVLVVDDDPEWLSFLSRSIGAEYPVLSETDGEQVVLKARIVKPDLIVLDVMLPGGMDGFTAFCNLRSDPTTCHIPVLMLTEIARKTGLPFGGESMEQYLGTAPTAFLEKPISVEQLLKEVRRVLR